MVCNIEEIGAAKMFVALGFARVDGRGFDGYLDCGFRRIGRVEERTPAELGEFSTDIRDHQVPNAEVRGGMRGIDLPLGWLGAL
jgi:hypothetical protein